jgi:hypothetical protein
MPVFSKGAMRKVWVKGKEDAKKKCVNKAEEVFLTLFSKDDFGPKLDDVEDLFPKKSAKAAEYKKAWDAASQTWKKLKDKVENVGITQMNIDTQKCLLTALGEIRKTLDGTMKP